MCGISGARTTDGTAAITCARISNNQIYRGKDSAGVAFKMNDGLRVFKRLGNPMKFLNDNETKLKSLHTDASLGHNRWPSHGKVTIENAHPFKSCDGSFTLVHNGSCNIPAGIWKFLRQRGHTIRGDTDSEMLMHTLEELIKANQGDRQLALRSFNKVAKSFSILTLFSDGEIWGTRDSWPAVIVQRANSTLIASEESGFYGIVPATESVKIIEPHPHTIWKLETSGDLTFWGEYDKEERPLRDQEIRIAYQYDMASAARRSIFYDIEPKGGKCDTAPPDLDRLEQAAHIMGLPSGVMSKRERKRMRKLIAANPWLKEELDNDLWAEEGIGGDFE